MLQFEMNVAAADLESRTIEGVLVPYGDVGLIQGRRYRFAQGSLELARSRTPLLVDHDRSRPIGVLADLVDAERQALARFSIDQTQDGDTALVQAASGSRGSLSVGVELVEAREAADGVVDVDRALLHEASLLALGAFTGATVTRVAAAAEEPEPEPDPDPEPDPAPAPPADPDPQEGTEMEATAAPIVVRASSDRQTERELNAGELVGLIVRAQRGERDSLRMLEAALQESISTDVSGLLPPTYERTVLGAKIVQRPLYRIFAGRPLPGVGLVVNKPQWTTPPDGAWAATVDDDAHSTKVVIGSGAANVERWDWAGAIPYVVVQRSDPSVIDEIYAAAVTDFYFDVETRIATLLAGATAGTDATIGAGIASFYTANGHNPEVVVVSPDVWGEMADAGALQNPVAAGGVNVSEGLTSTYAGLPIVASGALAAGTRILATRRALDVRTTEPVRLTANAIGALNVELAVVGEGLFDVDYPLEIHALGAAPLASSSRSSK